MFVRFWDNVLLFLGYVKTLSLGADERSEQTHDFAEMAVFRQFGAEVVPTGLWRGFEH